MWGEEKLRDWLDAEIEAGRRPTIAQMVSVSNINRNTIKSWLGRRGDPRKGDPRPPPRSVRARKKVKTGDTKRVNKRKPTTPGRKARPPRTKAGKRCPSGVRTLNQLDGLPPEQVEAIFLHLQGKTKLHIAEVLGVAYNTVRDWFRLRSVIAAISSVRVDLHVSVLNSLADASSTGLALHREALEALQTRLRRGTLLDLELGRALLEPVSKDEEYLEALVEAQSALMSTKDLVALCKAIDQLTTTYLDRAGYPKAEQLQLSMTEVEEQAREDEVRSLPDDDIRAQIIDLQKRRKAIKSKP